MTNDKWKQFTGAVAAWNTERVVIPLENIVQVDAWSCTIDGIFSSIPQRRSKLSMAISQSLGTFQS